jgi:hypothetical protein
MKKRTAYTIARWVFFLVSMLFLARFAAGVVARGHGAFTLAPAMWWRVGASAMVFASTAMFLVLGWHRLLSHMSHPLPLAATARVLCITQIAKYLPGNVGHHVGRVALARTALAVPPTLTAISIAQESALACLAALLVGAAAYAWQPALNLPFTAADVDFRYGLATVIGVGLLALALVNQARRSSRQPRPVLAWLIRMTPSWPAVRSTLPFYLATSLVNGIAVFVVASAVATVHAADAWLLTGAYALSWMVGFLIPGAPGGLGVRESALVLLLGNAYAADTVLAISMLSRLATVAADVLIFLAGVLLQRLGMDTSASR